MDSFPPDGAKFVALQASTEPTRVRFAEVRLPSTPLPVPGLEVRLPDGTVLRGGSAVELAALVRALRS